jgi:diguanylate cyclase (GGDEF)-like protein
MKTQTSEARTFEEEFYGIAQLVLEDPTKTGRVIKEEMLKCLLEYSVSKAKAQETYLSYLRVHIDPLETEYVTKEHADHAAKHVLAVLTNMFNKRMGDEVQIVRLHSHEFGIILSGKNLISAYSIAQVARDEVARTNTETADRTVLSPSISIGIASLTSGMNAYDLKHHADEAVKQAQRQQNTTVLYSALKKGPTNVSKTPYAGSTPARPYAPAA